MTREKLLEVTEFYIRWFRLNGHGDLNSHAPNKALNHCHHMCRVMRDELIPQSRTEKAMRWLGFVQGVLFARGEFTVAELKEHSRPADGQLDPRGDV